MKIRSNNIIVEVALCDLDLNIASGIKQSILAPIELSSLDNDVLIDEIEERLDSLDGVDLARLRKMIYSL